MVDYARSWLGTPFHHQGRVKGRACDCIGIVIKTAQEVLHHPYDGKPNYGRIPDVKSLLKECYKWMEPISFEEALPGDVLLLRMEEEPCHFGLITDKGVIHAYAKSPRKVVEHSLDDIWKKRIVKVFRIPGID